MFDLGSTKDICLVNLFKERWRNASKNDKLIYDKEVRFEFRQLEKNINTIISELPFLFDIEKVNFYKVESNLIYAGEEEYIRQKVYQNNNIEINNFKLDFKGNFYLSKFTLDEFIDLFISEYYQSYISLELESINDINLKEEGFKAFIQVRDLFIHLVDIYKYEKDNNITINEPVLCNNQDDNYIYSKVLRPYNDIILAFDNEYQRLSKEDTKIQVTNHIKPWLEEYSSNSLINTGDIRVLIQLIKSHYNIK